MSVQDENGISTIMPESQERIPVRIIAIPCPASIWILGGVTNCNKHAGHDGNHKIVIEWTTEGKE